MGPDQKPEYSQQQVVRTALASPYPMRTFLLVSSLLLLVPGCPGEGVAPRGPQGPAPIVPDGGHGGGGNWDVSPVYGGQDLLAHPPKDPSAVDGAVDPSAVDGAVDPSASPDATPPPQPDLGIQPQQGDGQPCNGQQPCAGGMVCISGQCRVKCTKTGICGVHGACPSTHGCIPTFMGYSVCVPANAQPGQSCSASSFCPVGHICGSTGGGYTCLPTCTKSPCGKSGNGQCISTGSNCSICSTI
jgi:hypothetical protein